MRDLIFVLSAFTVVYGQVQSPNSIDASANVNPRVSGGLNERIGNFSLELLYTTTKHLPQNQNLIISPVTTWTLLAVISEGASNETLRQINYALRLTKNKNFIRNAFRNIAQWLVVHTNTVSLSKFNAFFVDVDLTPEQDFRTLAKDYYDTNLVPVDFRDGVKAAALINQGVSQVTQGRINKLVDAGDFGNTQMFLVSAIYFKGQWTAPFNASSTVITPFYNSMGQEIGKVNMMYNRFTYPFSNIKELQARVIEIPYGKEDRLSMLVMLPYPTVTLEDMFKNFQRVPLNKLFRELKVSLEEYGEDEVDCFLPRFKIESDLVLTDILKEFGIEDLFDINRAELPLIARKPMYVSKVIHKAEIEVTEEGTTASGVTAAEFANRIGVAHFEANRPFAYLIVEKATNSIVFGGVYRVPSLY